MTWNPDIPALANDVADDWPDIEENFHELAKMGFNRSIFTYNGGSSAATVKCKGAYYSCVDKFCYWSSELTTGQAASGTPTADTWYYLYLDYSGITSGTAITNSELLWSTTAPSWSDANRGWYNGNDRCIFACLANSTADNFLEFFHDGGNYVGFADGITSHNTTATSWTDVTLSAPGCCTKVRIGCQAARDSDDTTLYVRTNGQTGSTGLGLSVTESASSYNEFCVDIFTDSSQKIEAYMATSGTATIKTFGWYLPVMM